MLTHKPHKIGDKIGGRPDVSVHCTLRTLEIYQRFEKQQKNIKLEENMHKW